MRESSEDGQQADGDWLRREHDPAPTSPRRPGLPCRTDAPSAAERGWSSRYQVSSGAGTALVSQYRYAGLFSIISRYSVTPPRTSSAWDRNSKSAPASPTFWNMGGTGDEAKP